MDKQNIIDSYNKKEESTDTNYHMDEPLTLCKWKKPDTKGHILYDSFILNNQNR